MYMYLYVHVHVFIVKLVYWYISQISGERLQDHRSSGMTYVSQNGGHCLSKSKWDYGRHPFEQDKKGSTLFEHIKMGGTLFNESNGGGAHLSKSNLRAHLLRKSKIYSSYSRQLKSRCLATVAGQRDKYFTR